MLYTVIITLSETWSLEGQLFWPFHIAWRKKKRREVYKNGFGKPDAPMEVDGSAFVAHNWQVPPKLKKKILSTRSKLQVRDEWNVALSYNGIPIDGKTIWFSLKASRAQLRRRDGVGGIFFKPILAFLFLYAKLSIFLQPLFNFLQLTTERDHPGPKLLFLSVDPLPAFPIH